MWHILAFCLAGSLQCRGLGLAVLHTLFKLPVVPTNDHRLYIDSSCCQAEWERMESQG